MYVYQFILMCIYLYTFIHIWNISIVQVHTYTYIYMEIYMFSRNIAQILNLHAFPKCGTP